MKRLGLFLLLTLVLVPQLAGACFGPKLYIGVDAGPTATVLAELATLYLHEKTGVDSVRVELGAGGARAELEGGRVDLAVTGTVPAEGAPVLAVGTLGSILAGPRPLQDLQFTTVVPALKKLGELLTADDLRQLVAAVAAGQTPAAAARQLLQARRWI